MHRRGRGGPEGPEGLGLDQKRRVLKPFGHIEGDGEEGGGEGGQFGPLRDPGA